MSVLDEMYIDELEQLIRAVIDEIDTGEADLTAIKLKLKEAIHDD
jgi:hypothetical protein